MSVESENAELKKKLDEAEARLKEAERPPIATRRELEDDIPLHPARSGGGRLSLGNGGLMQTLFASLAVTILVVFVALPMMGGGNLVSKTDFETNIKNINGTLNQTVSDLAKRQSDVNTAIQNIPNTINGAVNQSNSNISKQISDLSAKVDVNNKANADTLSKIDKVNTSINDLAKSNTTQEGSIKVLTDKVNKFTDQITALDKRIATLETKPTNTTPYSSGGSTVSSGGVNSSDTYSGLTATVSAMYASWSGLPMLTLSIQPPTGGTVTSINLTNSGNGYSTTPTVTLSGGGNVSTTATAVATITPITGGTVTTIVLSNPGSGYTSAPSVTITGGGIITSQATAVATINGGVVTGIALTSQGAGYSTIPTVTVSGGGGSGATATATINPLSGGSINNITVTNQGAGYSAVPIVTITGGGGSGAVATAIINPLVNSVSSQQFNMQLTNANAFTCTNVQMAIALALVDNTGNQLTYTPSWVTPGTNLTVTSFGMGTSWTYSTLVAPSTYVFSNNASSSFMSFGAITVPPNSKSNTYNLYVTYTNSNPAVSQTLYVYPMVKVYGYQ